MKYVQKLFMYAITQNRGNSTGLKAALNTTVPHMYGDHAACGEWCKYGDDPDSYRHKSLPFGKDLTSEITQAALTKIFSVYADNAEKLVHHGSSQANESLNNTVASKQPKSRHYGSSPSFNFRVGAAVAQKNVGYTYVADVCEKAGLSPSQHARAHGEQLDLLRDQKTLRQGRKEVKKRRLELKESRSSRLASTKVREGTQYQSECALLLDQQDNTEIAAPVSYDPIPASEACDYVVFDLETTGLDDSAEIVQIAACRLGKTFSRYVLPCGGIQKSASEKTGLSVSIIGGQRTLVRSGKALKTDVLQEVADDFIDWLDRLRSKSIVLVAHNCKRFDCRVLLRQFAACAAVDQLLEAVHGFADTLSAFKEALPGLASYAQERLVADYVGTAYAAHDAVADVDALAALIAKSMLQAVLAKHRYTATSAVAMNTLHQLAGPRTAELRSKLPRSALSKSMAERIARSGLGHSDLNLAYSRGQRDGLTRVLGEAGSDGNPRVTKTASVIKKLADHFELIPPGSSSYVTAAATTPATALQASSSSSLAASGASATSSLTTHSSSGHVATSVATTSPPVPIPTLSPRKRALYERRLREGYDFPDPAYLEWVAARKRAA
ncbi:uncharacterized protein LOC135827891 [Sycon ciliatum]|uniref:uncharacterized protein LOC135827891 n=1 Tax=Sycon ciliatum TaxID=27933 RepID=UPI0031F600CF